MDVYKWGGDCYYLFFFVGSFEKDDEERFSRERERERACEIFNLCV